MSAFETLTGLVSQYSPSGEEHGAVGWLAARMRSLGYDEAFIDDAGNAVGVMGKGPKQAILLGHIDTVPGKIDIRREGHPPNEVLYGRGAVDAKGPLACFVDAVAQAGARDAWQFVVIGAVGEECDSNGARYVVNRYQPDLAIVGEPNQWNRIALGYKGSAWANIRVERGQTHTAGGTQTAAEAAVDVWLKIREYVEAFNAGRTKLFDRLLVSLHRIDSTTTDFEQQASLSVGVRLPLDVSPAAWYGKLGEIAGEAVVESTGYAVPAWRCEKNTHLVRSFLSAIRSCGGEPHFVYKTGTADLNIVAPVWKCPALVYGPGDSSQDHTPNECIDLDDYSRAVTVLCQVLRSLG